MASATRQTARYCRGCWDQMHMPIPIRGPLAIPFSVCGITRSKMNPNICTICERSFSYVTKQKHISATATILFADIRGYTRLSERMEPGRLTQVVGAFQDLCAKAIWDHDGIVNKQMGDGLMAIFNFPIKIERHAVAAVKAAIDIQSRCKAALAELARDSGEAPPIGVGVGVHTGQVEIGEFSQFRSDFTAIGGAVNLTARLEAQAAVGEILVSPEAADQSGDLTASAPTRTLSLKGIDHAVTAHVLTADAGSR